MQRETAIHKEQFSYVPGANAEAKLQSNSVHESCIMIGNQCVRLEVIANRK